jgi:hypothetical protein
MQIKIVFRVRLQTMVQDLPHNPGDSGSSAFQVRSGPLGKDSEYTFVMGIPFLRCLVCWIRKVCRSFVDGMSGS